MSAPKSYKRKREGPKHPVIKPDGSLVLPPIHLPKTDAMRTNVNLLNFRLSKAKKELDDRILMEKAIRRYEKKKAAFDTMPKIEEPQYPKEMMSEARLQRMHYETLRECVLKVPIPDIQQHWIDGVIKLIPARLTSKKNLQTTINNLVAEMKSNFVKTLKELTVSTTLVSPEEFRNSNGRVTKDKKSMKSLVPREKKMDISPKSENFLENRRKINSTLHLYRPSVAKVFGLGRLFLEGQHVCDFKTICEKSPVTLKQLGTLVSKGCYGFEESVMSKWFPEVVKLLKKRVSTENLKPNQTRAYYRCLDTVMSVQLRDVIQRSLDVWMDLIDSSEVTRGRDRLGPHVRFQAALTFEDGVMQFYPSPDDFKLSLCEVVDKIVASLQLVPCVYSYSSEEANIQDYRYVSCRIFQEEVEKAYDRIGKTLKKRFDEAEEHLNWLKEQFVHLVDGRAMAEIERSFEDSEKSFDDHLEMSHVYKRMANEISLFPRVVTFDLLAVDCEDVKRDFVKGAKSISQHVLNNLASRLSDEAKRISSDYNEVYVKASSAPDSSEQLVGLIEFIETARVDELIRLEKRVEDYASRLLQLTEFHLFPAAHLSLNVEVFQWRQKISPVFEQSGERTESLKQLAKMMLESSSQKIFEELGHMKKRADEFNDYTDVEQMGFYAKTVREIQMKLTEVIERGRWINKEEMIHKIPITNFQEAEEVYATLDLYYRLFLVVSKWMKAEKRWMDGTFLELSAGQIEADLEEYTQELYKVNKQLLNRFRKSMRKESTPEGDGESPLVLSVISKVLEAMRKFRGNIPIIMVLCNLGLRARHWQQMSEAANFDLTPDSSTTLRKMLAINLGPFMEQFEVISSSASKEFSLEKAMNKMKEDWTDMAFSVTQYRDTGLSILASVDEVQMMLEDQIVKTQTMRGSPFIKPFEKEVKAWEERMIFIQYAIVEWLKVQSQWLYLSPIFSSEDITRQMPNESRMFKAVDAKWRSLMAHLAAHPLVLSATTYPNLIEVLKECLTLLDSILKGLNIYLETKRLYFPRFFFLSNDEMLEILSETKDPTRVQTHLKKCFEGINRLQFDQELNISAMFSTENEKVEFCEMISTNEAKGEVERWLLKVQEVMFFSIKDIISRSHKAYLEEERVKWVRRWPGQVVLCVSQMHWTSEAHGAIRSNTVGDFWHRLNEQLSQIVELVRGNLTLHERKTLGALVVLDVHARDVVHEMLNRKVNHEKDFAWLAQLRYYWGRNEEDKEEEEEGEVDGENCHGDVFVSIINAKAKYGYEYLGNTERLVITPLTDRCYRTLMGAFHLNLNGAPEGPAGTGKTETTKDLAKAVAVHCVVFNCSDGLDFIAMGKFFKGLASSGAWSCFDEFNRIELEVLSVVAQQILCIMNAIQAREKRFTFEGTELNLNSNCFICVTMNPGYAGRSELPDNLKVLFRTVAMMVPDYALIAEISLYSYGFLDARRLSVKIITTYRLCSEQLSSQFHYDYGMRAVKAVLSAAGSLKLTHKHANEDILLLRSIMDVNMPKFLSHDIPLFEGIISDLFPGVALPRTEHSTFLDGVTRVCRANNLQMVTFLAEKVVQMFEMMHVRHGFMLVGEPLGGKSVVIKVMADALNLLKGEGHEAFAGAKFKVINPKSITMGQLYGQFDAASHEWSDGIVANTFREFASTTSNTTSTTTTTGTSTMERRWVIFDGPIDALWVENMNTVLDDNRKLCLASGEVITVPASMNAIFETLDLSQASPATVSRCGMIYFESKSLGWKCFLDSWLDELPSSISHARMEMEKFVTSMLDQCLEFVNLSCKAGYVSATPMMLAFTFFKFSSFLVLDACPQLENKEFAFMVASLSRLLVFALVWTVGGLLDSDDRLKFDANLKDVLARVFQSTVLDGGKTVSLPQESIYNCFPVVDPSLHRKGSSWITWLSGLAGKPVEKSLAVQELLVPTIDTERYNHLLEISIRHKRPILLVGPTGTGKSMYVRHKLMTESKVGPVSPAFINFSAQSTANQIQELILSKLEKKRKGCYGAAINKRCVMFIDDFNMPIREVYGAQPPLELLRFCLDQGYWYDLRDTSKLLLQDIQFAGAMVPRDGRNAMNPRLLRHFHVVSINPFSDDTMVRIFATLVSDFFKSDNDFGMKMISATKEVYKSSIVHLRPTPKKSHYLFNLRDFSRVVNGLLLAPKDRCSDKPMMIRLWAHEAMRVFSDRLVDEEERDWFARLLVSVMKTTFGENINGAFFHKYGQERSKEEIVKGLMFGNHSNLDVEVDERVYEEISDLAELQKVIELCLEEYNSVNKMKMSLVIFNYVLEHLSRIARVLLMAGGNALLVGVGGSGRQSITRLAAYISNMSVFQPEVSKSYGINEWHEDVKILLRNSGGSNKPSIFLICDSQIKESSFLEEIDSLLNSGQVSNLFSPDELVQLSELVRANMTATNQRSDKTADQSPLELYSHFVKQCRDNLHVILAFSPNGSSFRTKIRDFPSLINCCTIDWFHSWPSEALICVASKFLERVNIETAIKQDTSFVCEYFHSSATALSAQYLEEMGRRTYITPTSYLDLINLLVSLLDQKQDSITKSKKRYICGLEKLAFAASQVSDMQADLERMKPQLLKMAEENSKMMKFIDDETQEMQYTTEVVRAEEVVAKRQAASAQALKDECEAELAEAIPALEMAIAALDTLKPSDITIVKSMVNPPSGVKLVMAAVCVMKGIPPERVADPSGTGGKVTDYWGPSKKLLSDLNFLRELKEFDKDSLQPSTMTKIRREFITNPDFDPVKVANASSAAEGLCKWVLAMEIYDRVAKVVAPKKEKMQLAEAELRKTLEHLKLKREELTEAEKRLNNLKEQFQEMVDKKEKLGFQVDLCEKKLDRAKRLIRGLGGERNRWQQATSDLQVVYEGLLGDVLVSSGIISYLGPFTSSFRDRIVADWLKMCREKNIPGCKEFSLIATLGDPVKIQTWHIAGLPKDSFSTDNAVIIANSRKWPLMIDPQGQANQWLKNMEKENKLHIIRFTNSDYMRTLENCITFGNPVLLENVGEELDPSLESLMLRQTFKQNGADMIRLGENIIEYSSEFRFYVTTKMRNPQYLPNVTTKVLLLNFMITREGLEDQLLGLVVTKERPELEAERQELILLGADISRQLREIEDRILFTLQSSEGNILEDETTVDFLGKSKTLSNEITEKQQVALVTEKQIEESRQCYQPVAKHSAVLFFCVAELPNLDPMYQFSLNWFINLYISSILGSNKAKTLEKRLQNLMNHFQLGLFENVCRSLSSKHRLVFSFLMCTNLLVSNGEMSKEEITFFLTGGVGLKSEVSNPDTKWISEKMWSELCMMSCLDVFKDFLTGFISDLPSWEAWYETPLALDSEMPEPWKKSLTEFHKMIIIRTLRPDRVVPAVQKFVGSNLGELFIESPKIDLVKSFEDSNFSSPLIFILSPGTDPIQPLLKFASDRGFEADKMDIVSLGQGQGKLASRAIERAKQKGTWVLLQNCHLAVSWMPSLEKICEGLNRETTHPDFRLWLSSYPSDEFPISVLQNGIKMTNEVPTGVRQNMLQSYTTEPISNPNFFYGCPNKQAIFEKLMFGLCLFHGVVQERKRFGSTGFNVPYAFNGSDLTISLRQLQMLINEYDTVPYDVLTYLTGECNYGGRVTDDCDRRCLLTLLEDFFNPDVVLTAKYRFSSSPHYYAPPKGSLENYIEFIKNLPPVEDHELFGMHSNVMTMKRLHDTRNLFDDLLNISGVNLASTKNDDQISTIIADILGKLLDEFDLSAVGRKYPVSYGDTMNALLTQEMARYNRLTTTIKSSLTNLQKSIYGLSVMTSELEFLGNSILLGKIPQPWMTVSYPSLKSLAGYINNLALRQSFFQSWYERGAPCTFWISGFFFIQAFLTGVMQNYARTKRIPIDQLEYDNKVLSQIDRSKPPEIGAHVDGMFLEGAKWDPSSGILVDEDPKVLHSLMPTIWFKPKKKEETSAHDKRYKCPLYNTSQRSGVLSTTGHSTNFVCFIPLDIEQEAKHWIKRGAALLCQLDD